MHSGNRPQLANKKLAQIIKAGLFHCTSVDCYKAIRSDGAIKPNLGDRPHHQGATVASRCFRLGMISLFDAMDDQKCSWLKVWLRIHEPVTIAIELNREALCGRILSCKEAGKLTSGLTLPGEVCCQGEISVQCIVGFLLVSTARPSLFKRISGSALSDEAIKRFGDEITQEKRPT
jgi:hypothetical protein